MEWESRPIEIAHLLNPAFCGAIMAEFIKAYQTEKVDGISFELCILVLPIVLHKLTRKTLPTTTRTQMHSWLQQNSELRICFGQRAKELTFYTKEAMKFLLLRNYIEINDCGNFIRTTKSFKMSSLKKNYSEAEMYLREYIIKSKLVGKWFAKTGSSTTIYTMWGICP